MWRWIMARARLNNLSDEIERRLQRRLKKLDPDSPQTKEALLRIGILIESEAKFNVRRKQIVDTGRLLNSIRHELYRNKDKAGVRVGSFGLPYAAMHEFGGPFTDRQRRAMFASLRASGKLRRDRVSKGVIRGNTFIARPFLRPAVEKHKPRIVDIVRNLIRGALE
jgi:phage gpG-like protein